MAKNGFLVGKMRISFIQGGRMDIDAVVNAANSTLIGGAASAARSTKQVDQEYLKDANAYDPQDGRKGCPKENV